MVQRISVFLITLLLAASAFGHGGHAHQFLGTIERTGECHFVMKTTKGETKVVFLTDSTRYEREGKPATKQKLSVGARVSVSVENDSETATVVKMGGGEK